MPKNFKRWIYHAELEPKVINSSEFDKHISEGWADTPAKFAKISDFGIDENNAASVQVLGEAMAGVSDRLNGELNIDNMKPKELEDYALKHFGVDLDRRRSVKVLRKEVKKLIGG